MPDLEIRDLDAFLNINPNDSEEIKGFKRFIKKGINSKKFAPDALGTVDKVTLCYWATVYDPPAGEKNKIMKAIQEA